MGPMAGRGAERLLITGCNGYIGRYLARAASCLPGAEAFGLDRQPPGGDLAGPPVEDVRLYEGDLFHPDLALLLQEIQPDVIFHAAAVPRTASLAEQWHGTALASERLLAAIVEAHLSCRVVLLGSAAEYGLREGPIGEDDALRPESDYGVVKASQTLLALSYAKRFSLPVVTGRIFNVYGASPPMLAIASIASQTARLEAQAARRRNRFASAEPLDTRLHVANLAARRDFIHIDDVVEALLTLRRYGRPGEIYNIGGGEAIALQHVADRLIALSECDPDQDVTLAPSAAQISDCSQANLAKIIEETPWRPRVSLEEGLLRELHYWRARLPLPVEKERLGA
ncbi:MAG: NAD-dependent epimerase/dehydratase family protein [Vampirovibrionales bacterium]|nr:NAD-dependent epimerase/dehydratase family protein [Vampirovibrionales bacterium]